jgi:hypothetical protein
MLRYFFVVQGLHEEIDDPEGTLMASDNAAIALGLKFIHEIKKDRGIDYRDWNLVVRDANGRTVISIPF